MNAVDQRAAEWTSVRLGLAGALVLALLAPAGWALENARTDEPSRLAQTERCLRREKLLEVGPVTNDPIAAEASRGSLATRVEGNGVHILLVGSKREAVRLADAYRRIGGTLAGRLEIRGRNVHLWEARATPTQRQTLFDCAY